MIIKKCWRNPIIAATITLRKYYVDGNKILGEDWYNYHEGKEAELYSKFRYYYSATGYVGFSIDGIYYSVLVDEQQNVTKVFSGTNGA